MNTLERVSSYRLVFEPAWSLPVSGAGLRLMVLGMARQLSTEAAV